MKRYTLLLMTSLLFGCSDNPSHLYGYIDNDLTYIAANSNGYLYTLPIAAGQSVKAGDLLFGLDDYVEKKNADKAKKDLEDAEAKFADLSKGARQTVLDANQAQLQQAIAEESLALIRYKREKTLFDKGVSNKDTLDATQAESTRTQQVRAQLAASLAESKLPARDDALSGAKAQVESARAAYEAQDYLLTQKKQFAPINAMIHDIYFDLGEYVGVNIPVVSLIEKDILTVIFYVPESKMKHYQVGQPIQVSCKSCDSDQTATISYISTQLEYTPPLVFSENNNATYSLKVKALIAGKNPLELKPGQSIFVREKPNAE